MHLLLLLFAGVLLGIFLGTLAVFVAPKTGLAVTWSLAVVCAVLLGAVVLAGALSAPRLAKQGDQLTQALPKSHPS